MTKHLSLPSLKKPVARSLLPKRRNAVIMKKAEFLGLSTFRRKPKTSESQIKGLHRFGGKVNSGIRLQVAGSRLLKKNLKSLNRD